VTGCSVDTALSGNFTAVDKPLLLINQVLRLHQIPEKITTRQAEPAHAMRMINRTLLLSSMQVNIARESMKTPGMTAPGTRTD